MLLLRNSSSPRRILSDGKPFLKEVLPPELKKFVSRLKSDCRTVYKMLGSKQSARVLCDVVIKENKQSVRRTDDGFLLLKSLILLRKLVCIISKMVTLNDEHNVVLSCK